MSTLQFELPGARVLDLFAGSGALGFESLSRGAAHVTFVEKGSAALSTITANAAALGAEPDSFEIVRGDAAAYVRRLAGLAFDIALADPPYGAGLDLEIVTAWEHTPFARLLAVEHAACAALPRLPHAWTKQYGDTAITYFTADP